MTNTFKAPSHLSIWVASKSYSLFSLICCLHRINQPTMVESPPKFKFTFIFFIIFSLSLGLVSFSLCIASEIKRNKVSNVFLFYSWIDWNLALRSFCFYFLKLVLNSDALFCRRRISDGMGDCVIYRQVQHLDWELHHWFVWLWCRALGILYCSRIAVQEGKETLGLRYLSLQGFCFWSLGKLIIFFISVFSC